MISDQWMTMLLFSMAMLKVWSEWFNMSILASIRSKTLLNQVGIEDRRQLWHLLRAEQNQIVQNYDFISAQVEVLVKWICFKYFYWTIAWLLSPSVFRRITIPSSPWGLTASSWTWSLTIANLSLIFDMLIGRIFTFKKWQLLQKISPFLFARLLMMFLHINTWRLRTISLLYKYIKDSVIMFKCLNTEIPSAKLKEPEVIITQEELKWFFGRTQPFRTPKNHFEPKFLAFGQ